MFWCGFHLIKEFTYTFWLSFINRVKASRKGGDLEREWEWQALIGQAGLSSLSCKVSHYPWEGGYQSPKVASPNLVRMDQSHVDGTTRPEVPFSWPLHTPVWDRTGLSWQRRGAALWRTAVFLVLPFSSAPCPPLRSIHRWETFRNLHQTLTVLRSVFRTPPHNDLPPPKKFEKMPVQPCLTLRPAASVPPRSPHWHCVCPLCRINRVTTEGMKAAPQTTGCLGTTKCSSCNWQCLAL